MTTTKRPKEVYREGYRRGAAMIRNELLPERFPFTAEGWQVDAIEVLAAGRMDDGREFQEIRIYTKEAAPKEHPAPDTASFRRSPR